MRKFRSSIIGVDQGSRVLFSDFEDGGQMWTGNGAREHRVAVRFRQAFRSIPAVHVAMSMWDMDQQTNQRADIAAENVTRSGFAIVFRTWGDTRVARVRADWMAIGDLPDEDDWDVR